MNEITLYLAGLLAPVLTDEGMKGLADAVTSNDPIVAADGASAFFRALTQSGAQDASEYLTRILWETETVFSREAAAGNDVSRMLARIDTELKILSELVSTPCETVRNKMPECARPYFPVWNAGKFSQTAESLATEYARAGYGTVRFSPALLFDTEKHTFIPMRHIDPVRLCDLKEYADEKKAAIDNTLAFLEGKPAGNVLFYGDRGTGKSSTVHALLNEFAPRGLRLLQLDKSAISFFPVIKEKLAAFPSLRFIVFLDDLSFESDDASFASLKAALEGNLGKADNVRIYATTNRRHLIKEQHSARSGDDVHAADTMEEQLSLFDRFGLVITYMAPDKNEYISILRQILADRNIFVPESELCLLAERFALRKGSRSPRAAAQLADRIQNGTAD